MLKMWWHFKICKNSWMFNIF